LFESLEHRLNFSDVSVIAAGGILTVTGSESSDEILVEQRGRQIALVAGLNTTINGQSEIVRDADDVRGIAFDMRAGDDFVRISGGRHAFAISVSGGDDNDGVVLKRTRLLALDFFGNDGNDAVAIANSTVRKSLRQFDSVGTSSTILSDSRIFLGLRADLTGNGANHVQATDLTAGDIRIKLGPKQDVLQFASCTANNVAIDLGGGNDTAGADTFDCRTMDLAAASGDDEVKLVGVNIDRRLRASMGGGRNLLRVDDSTILRGVDYTDNGNGRFYLSGTRLAGPASLVISNGRSTALLATNCRFSELQLALRGTNSTANFVSSPVDILTPLPDNVSTINRS
jgi:hypothetical protein